MIKARLLRKARSIGGPLAVYARWTDALWLILPVCGVMFCYGAMWQRNFAERRAALGQRQTVS